MANEMETQHWSRCTRELESGTTIIHSKDSAGQWATMSGGHADDTQRDSGAPDQVKKDCWSKFCHQMWMCMNYQRMRRKSSQVHPVLMMDNANGDELMKSNGSVIVCDIASDGGGGEVVQEESNVTRSDSEMVLNKNEIEGDLINGISDEFYKSDTVVVAPETIDNIVQDILKEEVDTVLEDIIDVESEQEGDGIEPVSGGIQEDSDNQVVSTNELNQVISGDIDAEPHQSIKSQDSNQDNFETESQLIAEEMITNENEPPETSLRNVEQEVESEKSINNDEDLNSTINSLIVDEPEPEDHMLESAPETTEIIDQDIPSLHNSSIENNDQELNVNNSTEINPQVAHLDIKTVEQLVVIELSLVPVENDPPEDTQYDERANLEHEMASVEEMEQPPCGCSFNDGDESKNDEELTPTSSPEMSPRSVIPQSRSFSDSDEVDDDEEVVIGNRTSTPISCDKRPESGTSIQSTFSRILIDQGHISDQQDEVNANNATIAADTANEREITTAVDVISRPTSVTADIM